ncbi:MAG: hydrogenase maturation protease [Thermodesulfovibrionales bacterium]|jgi:hydrogenase maturation protease
MRKNILILCCGHPFFTDNGFGYHVSKALEKRGLPGNVDLMEVGFSACMVPHIMEGKDKLIIVDIFHTNDKPGTVVRLKQEEVPILVNGKTDTAKWHLMETLDQMKLLGACPETIFIGVVPVDTQTESGSLSPEIEGKVEVAVEMIVKEINAVPPQ